MLPADMGVFRWAPSGAFSTVRSGRPQPSAFVSNRELKRLLSKQSQHTPINQITRSLSAPSAIERNNTETSETLFSLNTQLFPIEPPQHNTTMAPGLLHPSSDAEFAKILADNKGKLIVVDFFATWW